MALSNDIDMDKQGEKMLRDAFQNTVEAMENSKGQIYEIYENTKSDVEASTVMLKELKAETRKLQDEVEDRLAEEIIAGKISAGDKVIVSTKNKEIFIQKEEKTVENSQK